MGIPIFKEKTDHTIYRNSDGDVVPSITTILKMINKPELVYWANSLGWKRKSVTEELEISAYIGSVVHEIIEGFLKTGEYSIESMNKRGPVERIGIKNSFLSFMTLYRNIKNDLEVMETEQILEGDKCGGTMDLLAKYKSKLSLCDFKTSKSFYPSMILQLAGYDLLLRETRDLKVDQYIVILLDKKSGTQAKVKICDDEKEMEFYRESFKKLLDFYYSWYYINQKYWNKDLI